MATISSFIDTERAAAFMRNECKEQLISACEPIIQEAMKQIETTLRKQIGSIVIGMISTNFNVMRQGQDIAITVLHKEAP